ncbi:MAG: hypothetical protein ACRDPO_15895 [Streptosporangiaceae bacterium]
MSSSTAAREPTAHPANLPPGLGKVPWLMVRFAPYYMRHVLLQPYRGLSAADNVREILRQPARRHQVAVYDAVLELLLKGYAELAGHPLHPETGRVAVMLTKVGFAFDDEYERRKAQQQSVRFNDLLASSHVQARVLEWRDFMQRYEVYDSIRSFLMSFVSGLYQDYADTALDTSISFEAMLRGATLDSGGLLVAVAQVIALFHGDDPAEAMLAQFSGVGVSGKLADDVIDFRLDLADGRPNLLLALASEDEHEHARALDLGRATHTMGTRWWQRNCPRTYQRLVAAFADQQARITSRWLRYASSLMWTPALLGHARKKETRGRI